MIETRIAPQSRIEFDCLRMNAEEYIQAGQLDEALACAQEAVRKTPIIRGRRNLKLAPDADRWRTELTTMLLMVDEPQ